ncbi:MAG: tetratricopeptide repeat protein, partial [Myxococcota bacterium]
RRLFSREELLKLLWPDVFVSDEALSQHMSQLRRALRPFPALKTVPRRGYRLDIDVVTVDRLAPRAPEDVERSPEAPSRSEIPRPHNAFVGRRAELQALERYVGSSRVITVLGFGGVGKTRLVSQFAHEREADFPGGVWFCDLSRTHEPFGLVRAIATSLGVRVGADDGLTQLANAIAGRGRCLVILDNAEQVVEPVAAALERFADVAGDATFVVTSRVPLRIPAEQALWLSVLGEGEARDLFVDRARAIWPDATLDEADIAPLTEALDRLPLAIELAAARVRLLPLPTLHARLTDRFRLLRARDPHRPERHHTLRATLDWSWVLLSADEQRTLAQLSVFVGGFELEAAERVVQLEQAWTLDVLQSLVDQSLVTSSPSGRFDLLVTVAEYAAGKLASTGARQAAEQRHGAAVVAWVAAPDRPLEALEPEFDNLIAACRRATEREDPDVGVPALVAAWRVLQRRGPYALAASLVEGLRRIPLSSAHRADVDEVHGEVCWRLGMLDEALDLLRAVLDRREAMPDRSGEARVHRIIGSICSVRARHAEAEAHLERAKQGFSALGDAAGEAMARLWLGRTFRRLGRFADAQDQLDGALPLARTAVDRSVEVQVLTGLGNLHIFREGPDQAEGYFQQALEVCATIDEPGIEATVHGNLSSLYFTQDRYGEAETT